MKPGDLKRLQDAVAAEVEQDHQRIIQDAKAEAQALRKQAQSEAEALAAQIILEAEERVAYMQQRVIGAARLEAQALKTRKREMLLDQVFNQASRRLDAPASFDNYEGMVEHLTEDAAHHLRGREALVIMADPRAGAVLDAETLARLSRSLDTELVVGAPLAEAQGMGVVVQTPDGHLRYDNTLTARLSRMRDVLRPIVYRILIEGEP